METILSLNDLVILCADGADDRILYSARQHTVDNEAENSEFGTKQFTGPRAAALDEAFKVESLLQKGINIGLHDGVIERIVSETTSNPHGTCGSQLKLEWKLLQGLTDRHAARRRPPTECSSYLPRQQQEVQYPGGSR